MGDDSVIISTEVNGNHAGATAIPSTMTLQGSPFKKQQLPLLGNASPARANTNRPSPYAQEVAPTNQSEEPSGSEEMDIASPAPSVHVQVRIPPGPRFPPLPYSSSKTGLVYDPRMRFHAEPTSLMLNQDDIHPEDPRRIHEIYQEIQQAGLVQGPEDIEAGNKAKDEQCWRIHARPADKGEICLIHTPDHYDFIESLQSNLASMI